MSSATKTTSDALSLICSRNNNQHQPFSLSVCWKTLLVVSLVGVQIWWVTRMAGFTSHTTTMEQNHNDNNNNTYTMQEQLYILHSIIPITTTNPATILNKLRGICIIIAQQQQQQQQQQRVVFVKKDTKISRRKRLVDYATTTERHWLCAETSIQSEYIKSWLFRTNI
jgi:hypothetical protein